MFTEMFSLFFFHFRATALSYLLFSPFSFFCFYYICKVVFKHTLCCAPSVECYVVCFYFELVPPGPFTLYAFPLCIGHRFWVLGLELDRLSWACLFLLLFEYLCFLFSRSINPWWVFHLTAFAIIWFFPILFLEIDCSGSLVQFLLLWLWHYCGLTQP